MTLDATTYDLAAEIERLEGERDEHAERVAENVDRDGGGGGANESALQQAVQQGQQFDRYLEGLRWARAEWDAESVTLGGLTAGEDAMVEDHVTAARQRTDHNVAGGRTRIHVVAAGTEDAPYVGDGHLDTVANVADLHPGCVLWAETKVNELGSVEGNGQSSFRNLLMAKASRSTSTEASSETT